MNKHSEYISPYADEIPELLEADKPVKPQLGIDNKVRIDRTAVEKLDMIRDGLDINSQEFRAGYDLGRENARLGAFYYNKDGNYKVADRCVEIFLGG